MLQIENLNPMQQAALFPFMAAWQDCPADLREGLTFDEWVRKTGTHILKPRQVAWVAHYLAGGAFRGQS